MPRAFHPDSLMVGCVSTVILQLYLRSSRATSSELASGSESLFLKEAYHPVSHSFCTICLRGRVGPCSILGYRVPLSCWVRRPRQFNPAVPLLVAARTQLGNTCECEISTVDSP